jgi:hypothetical protein
MRGALGVAVVVLAFAGCGGGGASTTSSPPARATTTSTGSGQQSTAPPSGGGGNPVARADAIEAAIQGAFASRDTSSACRRYVTDGYVKQAYGGESGCEAAVRGGIAARSVRVKSLRHDRMSATAKAVPHGGPNSGATLTVSLVFESGGWKVDSAKANVPVGP